MLRRGVGHHGVGAAHGRGLDRALIAFLRALVTLLHVYSTTLLKRSLVTWITPAPRYRETNETLAGVAMRIGWWLPGRGARHPGLMLVIGATPLGIDFPELRVAAEGLARAGFLVMIPDLPFMKEERLDPTGPAQLAAAFATLRAHPEASRTASVLGFSVGGGVLLAAAGREPALASASAIGVLGAYFDLRTYIASVASLTQPLDGGTMPWEASTDVPGRMSAAARRLAADPSERAALDDVLSAVTYEDALARVDALPPSVRERIERLSPAPVWDRVRAPVFWLHDERDGYVPVAEAHAARTARPRPPRLRMLLLRVMQHAVPVADSARGQGIRFWVSELGRMLAFVTSLLRAAS